MASSNIRQQGRIKRKKRIRKKLNGTSDRPRLSVFRSSRHIYVQVVDDIQGHTLVSASTNEKSVKEEQKFDSKTDGAEYIGKIIAQRALDKGIKKVVFDRNGYLYHGRVKALSDGAREGGLIF